MISIRAALAAALTLASAARADQALVQAQQRTQLGVERFNAKKFDEALREFEAAFALLPMPRVVIHIAETHLAMGNKAKALEQFQFFLRMARLADTDRPAIEKKVEALSAAAPTAVDPEVESDLPAPEPLPEDRVERARSRSAGPLAIVHTPPGEIPLGKAIRIVAEVPREADALVVSLYYRNTGEAAFTRLALEPQGNAHVTAIPGRSVRSSAIQYYIEARDGGGHVAAVSGTETSPHLVVVTGGAAYAPKTAATPRMTRHRKWFWGTLAAATVLIAAGTVTAFLAEDRESALEQRAADSRVFAKTPGQRPSLFDSDTARIENEGQAFEAISVLTFALGGGLAAASGTFWYLDQASPKARAGLPAQLVWSFGF